MNKLALYEKSRYTKSGITFIGISEDHLFPLHWHEHIEFHFILRGSVKIQCNNRILSLGEGDCLIINANELHEGIETHGCECFRFKLHPSFFDQKHYVFSNLVHDDAVSALMLAIMSLYQSNDDASVYTVKGHIFRLIGHLCERYVAQILPYSTLEQNSEKIRKMNAAASYLYSHYATKIRVEALAEMTHYTYSYFSLAFKEVFGMPITKYLLSIRINKASALLATTEMNVTEVAACSGFSDTNYFARAFKKETGLSPTDYRKRLRADLT